MIYERARLPLAGLLVVATAASTVVLGGSAAAGPVAAASSGGGPAATVTLLTGDRVTLGGADGVSVRPAKGRERITFMSRTDERGDVHVVPQDVATLVSSGTLDRRLFDVSELVRAGYDDAKRKDLPLIVDYVEATPRAAGARVERELPAMSAAAVLAERNATFWAGARSAVRKIWLDGPVRASLEHSVPQIGAPEAWESGYTGEGTTIAVLDSGIDVTHPDLDDAVVAAQDFTGGPNGADDGAGHGTHVASIITGSGDRFKGVAPDAKLLNGKVLDDLGGGYESDVIAGMEWAAASGADVINMSLGSGPTDGTDPVSQTLNRLTKETGALFVVSAGNMGPGVETVGAPGAADAALTVGSVDRDERLADSSSRGPRLGDGAIKPDLTAPGVDIVAAKAARGWIGEPAGDGYVSMSGTSMAAPHVAGAAAILAGQHPDWTAERLKATLIGSAEPNADLSVYEQGAGRVDVAAAVESSVSASPASVNVGVALWPHGDDQPVAKTVAYTNSGTEPVTLDLDVEARGPDGNTAPAGMFTVSANQVTVPAGGRTEVTLTTDTTITAPDGLYSGALVATGDGAAVRTPLAVTREVESYDITVKAINHDGAPADEYFVGFIGLTDPKEYFAYDDPAGHVVRMPKGTYHLSSWVQTQRSEYEWDTTVRVEPSYVVAGDGEFVLDARAGKAVDFRVDEPDAAIGLGRFKTSRKTEGGNLGVHYILRNFDDTWIAPSTTSAGDDFEVMVEAELARPDGNGVWPEFEGSPYLYHARWTENGGVPATLDRRFTNRELVRVDATHAAGTPGMLGLRNFMVTGQLPFTLTEYYTPDVPWLNRFEELADIADYPPETESTTVVGRVYRKGKTVTERWNTGVIGPALPLSEYRQVAPYGARQRNRILVSVPLFTDPAPSREGWPTTATGSTQLLRDGQPVGETSYPGGGGFYVPAEEAVYTLRATANRGATSRLSTVVSGEWTFRSAHVPGDEVKQIPLLAVRFAPNLDDHNAAPAGRRFQIPVYVQRNDSAEPGPVSTPEIEVSYDDGKSWHTARVSPRHGGWTADVAHPRDAEFVSLRAKVSDPGGNAVSQTILRAYALK